MQRLNRPDRRCALAFRPGPGVGLDRLAFGITGRFGARPRGSLGFRRRRLRGLGLSFPGQAGNRCVDLHFLGALGDQDFLDDAFVDGLHLHRGLVGLDFGDHVAGSDGVTDLDVPLGQRALFHGGRKRRHQDVGHATTSV